MIIKDFTVELRCLVPWLTFQRIREMGPRSIIFTSGTLTPLDSW
jgi:Rad3-related DNA helicase